MYQLRYCAQATNAKFHTTDSGRFLDVLYPFREGYFHGTEITDFVKQILIGPSLAVGIPDIEKYSTITFIINFMNHLTSWSFIPTNLTTES